MVKNDDHIPGCVYGETKKGRYYKISVNRKGVEAEYKYTKRWYVPDGMTSRREILRQLGREKAAFELAIKQGEVLTREELKERERAEAEAAAEAARIAAAEKAKLRTVRQYAAYFMSAKETTIAENTRYNYQSFLDKHILPVIGDVLLHEVTPAMLSKLLLDFQKAGYSHSSAVKLYNVLNGLFDMAFMDESIPISPMLKVKRPAPRKDEKLQDEAEKALTASQLALLLSFTAQEPLQWRTYIALAADSGARKGEICALQWRDISWDKGTITIRRNLQYTTDKHRPDLHYVTDSGVYVTNTKTGKIRTVDLGEETLALLRQLKDSQKTVALQNDWVFRQGETTDPMFPQSPTLYFRKLGKRFNEYCEANALNVYKIENFHPHLLRHTVASIAVTSGADLKSTADRLGHSEAVLLRKYVHSTEESVRKSGQTVRDEISKASNE